MKWQGVTVEILIILRNHGFLLNNRIASAIIDHWFKAWIDYKIQKSMADLDQQIEESTVEPQIEDPIYQEKVDGETPLGGEMRLKSGWTRD
jgi:hypothetical protein